MGEIGIIYPTSNDIVLRPEGSDQRELAGSKASSSITLLVCT